MADYSASNKRVAKNTAFLYLRMLFLTLINLYTVRITLQALGVVDYGIYNVVASVVGFLGFLNGTLTSATQRFLSYHLGRNDYKSYSKTFSLLMMGFIVISVIILILAEALGYFMINDWLILPKDRIFAATCVYQTSIITFVFTLLLVPYSSSIVANEKMKAFAYISVIDGILKLALVYLLVGSPIDRLIFYGVLTMGVSIIIFATYACYCHKAFPYCKFHFEWDRSLFKELTAYTGWNLFGSISGILITQGQNILLNIFFGPIVNTAKGIADKINNVVNSFSSNFYMAISPQIVKSYASGDYLRMMNLAVESSRMSYFLILLISFPLIVCMQPLLMLWLGEESVSSTMIDFSNLTLIYCLIITLEQPITQMIRATGQIKRYQIQVGICTLCYVPIAGIVLWLGANPVSSMIVLIILYALVQVLRVKIAHHQVGLNILVYLKSVILPVVSVSLVLMIIYLCINGIINREKDVCVIIFEFFASLIVTGGVIWLFGLNNRDKKFVVAAVKNFLKR